MAFLGGERPFELLPCDAINYITKKEELFPGSIFPIKNNVALMILALLL
jgi:hypothetical protein